MVALGKWLCFCVTSFHRNNIHKQRLLFHINKCPRLLQLFLLPWASSFVFVRLSGFKIKIIFLYRRLRRGWSGGNQLRRDLEWAAARLLQPPSHLALALAPVLAWHPRANPQTSYLLPLFILQTNGSCATIWISSTKQKSWKLKTLQTLTPQPVSQVLISSYITKAGNRRKYHEYSYLWHSPQQLIICFFFTYHLAMLPRHVSPIHLKIYYPGNYAKQTHSFKLFPIIKKWHSWDEWVPPSRLLKYNDENVLLQKQVNGVSQPQIKDAVSSASVSISKGVTGSKVGGSASIAGRVGGGVGKGLRGTKRGREDVSDIIIPLSPLLFYF